MKIQPLYLFVVLVLVGITSAFLFLSVSYFLTTYGTSFNNFKLPVVFHANTVIILFSGYSMMQTQKAALWDDWNGYKNGLLVTSFLGLAFTLFQFVGWQQLMDQKVLLTNNVAAAYLYVISGLHIIHLLVGIGLLFWFLYEAWNTETDQVKLLLLETNPMWKTRMKSLALYWNFVDILWLYLYIFFVVNIYLLTKVNL
jgi:cytochrome c oxidase subunit 3